MVECELARGRKGMIERMLRWMGWRGRIVFGRVGSLLRLRVGCGEVLGGMMRLICGDGLEIDSLHRRWCCLGVAFGVALPVVEI